MSLKHRVKKLELIVQPKPSGSIVAHSMREAEEKLKDFYRNFPHGPTPRVMIFERIEKPVNAGT